MTYSSPRDSEWCLHILSGGVCVRVCVCLCLCLCVCVWRRLIDARVSQEGSGGWVLDSSSNAMRFKTRITDWFVVAVHQFMINGFPQSCRTVVCIMAAKIYGISQLLYLWLQNQPSSLRNLLKPGFHTGISAIVTDIFLYWFSSLLRSLRWVWAKPRDSVDQSIYLIQ